MYLLVVALFPVMGVVSPHALGCSLKRGQSTNFTFPSPLHVPRDLPIGGVIYDTHGWIGIRRCLCGPHGALPALHRDGLYFRPQ